MKTIKQTLLEASAKLGSVTDSPRLDAELLLSHCLEQSRTYFFTHPDRNIEPSEEKQFSALIEQRLNGAPIAYITGEKAFWSLNLKVTADVLIPRADTEILVEVALNKIHNITNPTIFDLGTGSGAIALAIATERPDATIYASDTSDKALQIAQENAKNNQLTNITFIQSNWFNEYPLIQAHLIVSNPPYIAYDCPHLEINVKKFEPNAALFSDENGHHDLLTIIKQSKYYLCRQGELLLEHGMNQEVLLMNTLKNHGFINIESHQDIQKINRCISASISQPG